MPITVGGTPRSTRILPHEAHNLSSRVKRKEIRFRTVGFLYGENSSTLTFGRHVWRWMRRECSVEEVGGVSRVCTDHLSLARCRRSLQAFSPRAGRWAAGEYAGWRSGSPWELWLVMRMSEYVTDGALDASSESNTKRFGADGRNTPWLIGFSFIYATWPC